MRACVRACGPLTGIGPRSARPCGTLCAVGMGVGDSPGVRKSPRDAIRVRRGIPRVRRGRSPRELSWDGLLAYGIAANVQQRSNPFGVVWSGFLRAPFCALPGGATAPPEPPKKCLPAGAGNAFGGGPGG
eukprot:14560129-Alexandrium_andersonii.AAC.1